MGFTIFISLLGGLAIFLLGMEQLSTSVRALAGHKIREMLNVFTRNKVISIIFGIVFTVLFQSSSAASVVLVSFVDAGLIAFGQTIPILLGTGIGTTITVQIISFNLGQYALVAVAVGFFLGTFSSGNKKHLGFLVLGLGLLFFGMQLMTDAMVPLKDNETLKEWLAMAVNPFWGVLAAVCITSIIQSSAAFLGIVIILLSGGLINFEQSLPMIIGANIGTTITALLAAINASHKAIKVAIVNTLFRILAGVVFLLLIPYWKEVTVFFTSDGEDARLVANAHTLFNIGMVVVLYPATGFFARKIEQLHFKRSEKVPVQLKYLNSDAVAVAGVITPVLQKELVRMGKLVYDMLDKCMQPFFNHSLGAITDIRKMEDQVDTYREEINHFLIRSHKDITIDSWSDEAFRLLHIMNELEQVADIISVSIMQKGEEWLKHDIEFSEEGKQELIKFHTKSLKQMNRAISLIENSDYSKAARLKRKYRKYAYMAFDLEMQHLKRVYVDKSSSPASSKIHMELINHLRMINSKATNFGRIMLLEDDSPQQIF